MADFINGRKDFIVGDKMRTVISIGKKVTGAKKSSIISNTKTATKKQCSGCSRKRKV